MKYEYVSRKTKVGERGQVTIPKKLRARYGVEPGSEVVFEERKDGLLIKKVMREDPLRELVGVIRDVVDVDRYLEQTRGPAWDSESDQR
jgi:AbrB family looped-hinge helix DNA binding protein